MIILYILYTYYIFNTNTYAFGYIYINTPMYEYIQFIKKIYSILWQKKNKFYLELLYLLYLILGYLCIHTHNSLQILHSIFVHIHTQYYDQRVFLNKIFLILKFFFLWILYIFFYQYHHDIVYRCWLHTYLCRYEIKIN